MTFLGGHLYWAANRIRSARRRLSSAMWRAVLGEMGSGSTIGTGWRIEEPGSVFVGNGVFLGNDGWVSFNADASEKPKLAIGNGTYIGNYFLASISRKIEIGDKVMISDRVYIGDCNHRHSVAEMPIIDQGIEFGGEVAIGFGSWIGVGAAILPGVTIGNNCVIGANAVVTHDVPDGAIVGGAPAQPLNRVT